MDELHKALVIAKYHQHPLISVAKGKYQLPSTFSGWIRYFQRKISF